MDCAPCAAFVRRLASRIFELDRYQHPAQMTALLDPQTTLMDSVADGRLSVTISGRTQHVAGYLQDFLFPS